jgi:hypothetical protein
MASQFTEAEMNGEMDVDCKESDGEEEGDMFAIESPVRKNIESMTLK